jgi:exosortase N
MSPVFQYIADVFSFPIRLQLSTIAGYGLSFTGKSVQVVGNTIYFNNNEFAVDPACMGLNMLTASLLLGIMLIGFYKKKWNKQIAGWQIIAYLLFVFGLNVISNLLRIILLVQFAILPGTALHEITGLTCFLIYVILPAAFVAKLIVGCLGKTGRSDAFTTTHNRSLAIHLLLLVGISLAAIHTAQADTYRGFYHLSKKHVAGYQVSSYSPGILKLEDKNALIYVKYIRGFYDTDHNPTICWKGSGYEFHNIQKERLVGNVIYTATLQRNVEKLYTAWWYSNGKKTMIDQLKWRSDMMRTQSTYAVVNVTAATKEELHKEVSKIVSQNSLSSLFNHQ